MSDQDRDKKIDELLKILRHAPALNGGFDKLSNTVEEIKECNTKVLYELQLVKTNQDVHNKKIEKLHKDLYDPDTGLYKRVSIAVLDNEHQTEDINNIKEKAERFEKTNQDFEKKITNLEEKNSSLERIAGKDYEDLREVISARKNMTRALWIFTSAALAGLIKLLWDIVPLFF